jgi:hypothetical protein
MVSNTYHPIMSMFDLTVFQYDNDVLSDIVVYQSSAKYVTTRSVHLYKYKSVYLSTADSQVSYQQLVIP